MSEQVSLHAAIDYLASPGDAAELPVETQLAELQLLLALERCVRVALQDRARGAHANGVSWRAIAEAAGTSTQNAFQRWAKRDTPKLEELER